MNSTIAKAVSVAATALTFSLALTACGSDDEAPRAGTSSTPSDSASAGDASTEPSPSVSPATGIEVGNDLLVLRAADVPGYEPWSTKSGGTTGRSNSISTAPVDALQEGLGAVTVSVGLSGSSGGDSLEQIAQVQATGGFTDGLTRGPDTTLGGEPAYVFTGTNQFGEQVSFYGGVHADTIWRLDFTFDAGVADTQAFIAPMLASLRFR